MSFIFSLEEALQSISEITLQIQQCLELEEILQCAIADARERLHLDHLLIYRLQSVQEISVAFESVGSSGVSLLGQTVCAPCLETRWVEHYQQGHTLDLISHETGQRLVCHAEKSTGLRAQAKQVLPLLDQGRLWGLLVANHYSNLREWQPSEAQYLQQIALHLSIAIQQANLLQAPAKAPVIERGDRHSVNQALYPLQVSDDTLSNFLERIGVCVAQFHMFRDGSWEYDYISNGSEAVFGFSAQALMDHKTLWSSQIFPDERELLEQKISNLIAVGGTHNLEYRFCHPDGTVRWIAEILSSQWSESDHCWVVTLVSTDISKRKNAEIALAERELRLSTLIGHLPGYVYRVHNDPNYTSEFISPGVTAITGYEPDEYLVERSVVYSQVIHPDDADAVWQTVQDAVANRKPYECEYRIITKTGQQKWVWDRGNGIYGEDGSLAWLEGFVTDISDRKRSEAERQQRDELIQNIAQGVSAATGKAFFNSLVGYLIRLLGMDQVFVSEIPSTAADHMKVISGISNGISLDGLCFPLKGSPCEQVVKQGFRLYADQLQLQFPDDVALKKMGGESYVGIPLFSSAGTVIGLIGMISNHAIADVQFIEEVLTIFAVRAASELERQQSEALLKRYERIVSATPDCVALVDRNYIYRVINKTYLSWNLKSYDEIVGHSIGDLIGQEFFDTRVKSFIDACLSGETEHTFESWQNYADGKRRYVRATYAPYVEQDGIVSGVVINVHDLTRLKLAEGALKESEERFREIVNTIPQMFFVRALNPDRFVYISPAYEKIWGRSREELMQNPLVWMDAIHPDDRPQVNASLGLQFQGKNVRREYRIVRADGAVRWISAEVSIVRDAEGNPIRFIGLANDISDRKAAEAALAASQQQFQNLVENSPDIIERFDLDLRHLYVSPALTALTGIPAEVLLGKTCRDLGMDGHMVAVWEKAAAALIETGQRQLVEFEIETLNGLRSFEMAIAPEFSAQQTLESILCISRDVTERRSTEAMLKQQAERERLLKGITQNIRQTLDLDQILKTTVTEVRQFLEADRVVIYRLEPDGSGLVIEESVAAGWKSILGLRLSDLYFSETQEHTYQNGSIQGINDIYAAPLRSDHIALLEHMQVRAKLVVPILLDSGLWGLLVAQQCGSPRQWNALEIELQQQLATQIAIAIQQANLYRQSQLELVERQRAEAELQRLNQELEQRVRERTQALQNQFEQERLFRKVIQNIHRSLDLQDVLTTVLYETRQTLKADRVAIYQFHPDWSGSFVAESVADGWVPLVETNVYPVWVDTYLQENKGGRYQNNETFAINDIYSVGHSQCHIELLEQFQVRAYAIAPIFLDEKLWGLLATYQNSGPREWQNWEVRLLQQISIQTAIALRQSQLYQASQAQVEELERLHQLKDDFLSTVSHELRSPMSNIKLATQMLEISLTPLGVFDDETAPISRYFKVLQEEGQRETNLINDLLDLARLDAGTEMLQPMTIALQVYIPHVAEPFFERTRNQQQQLVITIPEDLPAITTDLSFLERILTELLHNACKYTPAGEVISITACSTTDALEIHVSNSGAEIPAAELERIFDKFYRIPNSDPWKHGGTGLGLALVRKLMERLGGSIHANSHHNTTTFILKFKSLP